LLDLDVESTLSNLHLVRKRALERSEECAFEFALLLYTLKQMNLVKSIFPEALRATVHPKPGQWGLHLVNKRSGIFPWHGIAYKKLNGQWRIKYEFDAIRRNAIPVHLEGDMYPFYYEETKQEEEDGE